MNFVFRPLTQANLPTLHAWLQRPHVAEWWKDRTTLEELEQDYLSPAAAASSTRAFIAHLDGEPIGFIQVYTAMDSGGGWWEDETDPGVRGIDQFLADDHRLGKGVGSAMIRAFVEEIFRDSAVTKVQIDPDPANLRAVRAYIKAGFRPVREITTPDGRALLMICERSGAL